MYNCTPHPSHVVLLLLPTSPGELQLPACSGPHKCCPLLLCLVWATGGPMENLGCPNMLGTNLSPESGVSMALRGSPQILDDSLEPLARGSCWSCDVEPGIGPLAQEELGLPSLSTAGSSRRQCWSQELDQLRERQAQLKEQLCACAQELGVVRRHEQRLQEANKELQEQLRVQEAKVEQLRSTLATRGAHQGQELRRREQELGRLKDRLGQVMMDKRDRRTNMDILNPLSRANGRRATWKTGKALGKREEELYRSLLGTQEKQMAVLAVENAELQLALEQLGHDFQGLLPPGQDGDPKLDSTHLADVIWELWGCLKARVEALGSWAVAGAPPGLGGADGELPVISVTDHDKEIARLRAEIEESRSLIAWQQQCLQEKLVVGVGTELPPGLEGCYVLEEQQRLQEERMLFQRQQQAFEAERQSFTEAAIRLGHERQQFEAERALLLKHQFLSAAANLDLWGPQRQESAPSTTWVLDQEPHPQAKKRPQPSYSPFLVPETSAMPFRSQLLHPQPASTPCLGEQCWGQCLILHYSPATPAQPRLLDAAWKGGHQDRASQTQSEDLWPAIHGFRETEKSHWSAECQQILERVRAAALPPNIPHLGPVHVLDLDKNGYIKPHVDSVKFCGCTIAGLSLLSASVMRLVSEENPEDWLDMLLPPCSLYILRGPARYNFTHQILRDEDSFFNGQRVPRKRRISLICRSLPLPP
ncbi:hypothetical protein Y1Q_0009006 [Alligator mississippiensis]|uniref:Alpha-ketoglutarate-dependent dioxygenase AlkB-like domain-containing protein n=1 Tax=Alligator mississippiensis TaxID=8496 RepID=A0A151NTU0_ALLMI|nr:hypothetical protein Y1Q_0009006 [Alligator mississippiensis]